jgi:hypothetical protein
MSETCYKMYLHVPTLNPLPDTSPIHPNPWTAGSRQSMPVG